MNVGAHLLEKRTMPMELSGVLRCIRQLLTPPKEGTSVLLSLEETLDTFQSFSRERELTNELELATSCLKIPEHDTLGGEVALYCKITNQAAALLTLLDEALKQAHGEDLSSAKKHNQSPSEHKQKSAPKAMLSSTEEKSIYTLLQFVVALGIFPFLLPGADSLLQAQLGEMAPQITKSRADPITNSLLLFHHCRPLVRLFHTPVIGPSVVSRHLSTALVALLQVSHSSRSTAPLEQMGGCGRGDADTGCSWEGGSNAGNCPVQSEVEVKEELTCMLDKLHQPMVVRELLRIQGAQRGSGMQGNQRGSRGTPNWLQRACGSLLSDRLMKQDGVHSVLVGILGATAGEGVGPGCHGDWKRVQAVAQIISRCPSQVPSLSHYYSIIGPQLLKLLSVAGGATVQVSVATLSLMMKTQPALTRSHVILPLTAPLRTIAAGGDFSEPPTDLGRAVEFAVGRLHRLCGNIEPSSPLMPELQPFLPLIFKIWQATNEAGKISKNFKSDVVSVLVTIFNSLDSMDKVKFLRHVAGMPPSTAGGVKWIAVSPQVSLTYPSEGRGLSVGGGEEGEMWSVERMERDGRAMIDLVGAVLRSSQLIGPFFVECLTCVVAILCEDLGYQPRVSRIRTEIKSRSSVEEHPKSSKPSASSVLLEVERRSGEVTRAESYRRSLVLYLTAALSEESTSHVLEQTDTTTLLEILAIAVECHAHIASRKNDSLSSSSPSVNLLVVGPDLDRILGGPITLSIALGYLSAILTGVNQLEKEQRGVLSGLLTPLEVVSTGYPDTELAALAGDLRVCIATLGAVWSGEMRERAEGRKGGGAVAELQRESENVQLVSQRTSENSARGLAENKKPVRKLIQVIPETNSKHTSSQTNQQQEGINQEEGGEKNRFQRALVEAQDPEIAVRGHGLSSLARLVTSGDRETLAHSERLLQIFRDALSHSDSYIYLPAIGGLVGLASREPQKVLTILCEGYALFSDSQPRQSRDKVDKQTGKLNTNKETVSEQSGRTGSTDVCVELRLKLGEGLVRVSRECGELLPHYSDQLLAAVLSNARDPHPLVRASALSNLADICRLLGHSFHKYHHEVLGCVSQLLQSDPAPQVQQSALLVLTLLLKGLSHQTVEVLGDSLRDVYRLLKTVERERGREELTRDHARAALAQLDQIMRVWAFPAPSLSKNITVL